MSTITIPLPEVRLDELKALARLAGISPEEFVRATLEEWLRHSKQEFAQAASYVLNKNAELYRRLA